MRLMQSNFIAYLFIQKREFALGTLMFSFSPLFSFFKDAKLNPA